MQIGRDGLGYMVPGMFAEPENPILRGARAADAKTSLGQFADASFPVPQNPLRGVSTLNQPIALVTPKTNALDGSLRGLRCGPCASPSLHGMGALDIGGTLDAATTWLSDSTFGVGNMWLIGGAALLWLMTRRGGKYREDVQSVRRKHLTVAGRAVRSLKAF